jgi:hypothetical protein
MVREREVAGAIIDSWVEPAGRLVAGSRVVLQVAPRDRPRDLVIVEAALGLIPDGGWLEDLGENLCHGSPIEVFGDWNRHGLLDASRIELRR